MPTASFCGRAGNASHIRCSLYAHLQFHCAYFICLLIEAEAVTQCVHMLTVAGIGGTALGVLLPFQGSPMQAERYKMWCNAARVAQYPLARHIRPHRQCHPSFNSHSG